MTGINPSGNIRVKGGLTEMPKYTEKSVAGRGQMCPHCGATEFDSEIDDWEEPEMVELNTCGKCGQEWKVGYHIMFAWVEAD